MSQKRNVQFNKTPEQVLRERRQQERRGAVTSAKRERAPLGGAPEVKIPPLNAQPMDGGGSMEDQAEALRDPTNPLSPVYNPQLAQMAAIQAAKQDGQAPFSVLPPRASEDPRFRPGVGSMISGNQPQLNEDGGYKPKLSEKTVESMKALSEFHAQAAQHQQKEIDETRKPKDAKDTSLLAETNEEEFKKELQEILGDSQIWNKLNNPERRKEIESRLESMDLMDIIMNGEVHQDVPIIPKKFEATFRSVSGEEDLAVKRLISAETGGNRYVMDKFTMMNLCLGLVSINGRPLPSHLDDTRTFKEEKFLDKFNRMIRFPVQMLADLGVQYMWFDDRVRDLFIGETETLKNS